MTLSHSWEGVPEGRERESGRAPIQLGLAPVYSERQPLHQHLSRLRERGAGLVARLQSGKPLPNLLLGFHPNHTGPTMADDSLPILPEVRLVKPGETHHLCRCGHSPEMPDCPPDCAQSLILQPEREQRLLLCRCSRSAILPCCDGSHSPPASGLADRWRCFFGAR